MIESLGRFRMEGNVDWDIVDFAVLGAMLLGVALIYALAKRKANNATYKFALGIALLTAFLLMWVNGAVGLIGSENNDANMMYFGVLGVGFVGALIARLQPRGMSLALYATAVSQVAVAAIAIFTGAGSTASMWPQDVLFLTGFFVALWLLSAWLFRRAARRQHAARYGEPRLLD